VEKMDDNSLITAILRGEIEHYEVIMNRYQRSIYYMGLKFFHNESDAQDFTQEVFIHTFKKLQTFSGEKRFFPWLYKLAYNLAVNHYKLKNNHIEIEYEDCLGLENNSPENELLNNESKTKINEVLSDLPDIYNLVIKMHYFDNLTYPEISTITGKPVNTIKSYIHRAKEIVKAKLIQYIKR
jgi:RNA polymerase sigma-70 factor (ECF subfamily)